MREEIKSCPFCGSDNRSIWIQNVHGRLNMKRGVYLACVRCKAYGPDRENTDKAIQSWNMRDGQP